LLVTEYVRDFTNLYLSVQLAPTLLVTQETRDF
jgi:hypothetical protein